MGYELAHEFWRQGIMTEAISAILSYGFEVKNLQRIIAEVMIDNLASKQLLQNLGFQSHGILKERGFWKGKHHDLEQFVLSKPQTQS